MRKKYSIEKIYIACYKGDLHFTRICVTSIRYWYPDIPIFLLKDGEFDSTEIEQNWQVEICALGKKDFGWSMIKLEPLFFSKKEKILVIDSDICFIGKVLDKLSLFREDFIVSGYEPENLHEQINTLYFDLEKLKKIDKNYKYPGFLFNGGQLVITTGLLDRYEDFGNLVDWGNRPTLKKPDVFFCADQGILNYVFSRKVRNNEITVGHTDFQIWSHDTSVRDFNLNNIINGIGYEYLIHWAGFKEEAIALLNRSDILFFYEKIYYSKIRNGTLKMNYRRVYRGINFLIKSQKRLLKRIKRKLRIEKD